MTLSALIFIAGLLTLVWAGAGFVLLPLFIGEKIFTDSRPYWLVFLSWAYATLAILAGSCLPSSAQPLSYLIVGILILSAAKFFFFYIFYSEWHKAFRYLWNRRIIFVIILSCAMIVGALMLVISTLRT